MLCSSIEKQSEETCLVFENPRNALKTHIPLNFYEPHPAHFQLSDFKCILIHCAIGWIGWLIDYILGNRGF